MQSRHVKGFNLVEHKGTGYIAKEGMIHPQRISASEHMCEDMEVDHGENLLVKSNSRRGFFQTLLKNAALVSSSVVVIQASTSQNSVANAVETLAPPPPLPSTLSPPSPLVLADTANPNLIQFETVGMVPRIYFEEKRSIYGFVERVLDGDTIRVTHVPNYAITGKAPEPIQKRGIADITLAIRFYGIDAPEVAKNKNQTSQPFGEESKQFVYDQVYHKMVKITFLQKDRYGRAVGAIETIPQGKDLSIELARLGLAEMYTGGGAQYWTKKEQLEKAVAEAKKANRGIWSLGDAYVSAAEQKRILREEKAEAKVVSYDTSSSSTVDSDDCYDVGGLLATKKKKLHGGAFLEAAITGLELIA